LKVHDVDLPGYPSVMGYISLDDFGEQGVYKLLLEKLGAPSHEGELSSLGEHDSQLAREIIEACFRRAIYTRMDSEISVPEMCHSIGRALQMLQRICPRVQDQALQWACNEIIRALDEIQRLGAAHFELCDTSLSQANRPTEAKRGAFTSRDSAYSKNSNAVALCYSNRPFLWIG
jgi:hypothetical protein